MKSSGDHEDNNEDAEDEDEERVIEYLSSVSSLGIIEHGTHLNQNYITH